VKLTVKMDESMELIGIFPGLQVTRYRKSNAYISVFNFSY